jgi:hypothetical protein
MTLMTRIWSSSRWRTRRWSPSALAELGEDLVLPFEKGVRLRHLPASEMLYSSATPGRAWPHSSTRPEHPIRGRSHQYAIRRRRERGTLLDANPRVHDPDPALEDLDRIEVDLADLGADFDQSRQSEEKVSESLLVLRIDPR